MSEQSLKDKTVKGGIWSAIDYIARYGISFVVGIILARLLTPDDYGLIGIITIFISLFNYIVDGGLGAALIRKLDADDDDYSTLFFANLVISIFLSLLLIVSAPLVSVFFEREQLTIITRVMSIIIILDSLTIVQKVRLTKRIDFRTQAKVAVSSSLISGSLGVAMAYLGLGVWALVGQQISSYFFNSLFLWVNGKWMPNFVFRFDRFKEMWAFGWKLLVSSIIGSLWDNLYSVIIAKNYSTVTLGHYSRANQFATLCPSTINSVIQRVSYPVLCSFQNDYIQLKQAYSRIIRVAMLPSFVLALGLAACADSFIVVLIGDKWIPCIPYLQILCFSLMLYPLHALNINVLQVVGRSDLTLYLRIVKTAFATIPLFLGIFFNIYYMLWGSVLVGFVSYLVNAYFPSKLISYSMKEQLFDILPSFLISSIMAAIVYAISFISMSISVKLVVQLLVGGVVTIILCEVTKLFEYLELKKMVMKYIKKK